MAYFRFDHKKCFPRLRFFLILLLLLFLAFSSVYSVFSAELCPAVIAIAAAETQNRFTRTVWNAVGNFLTDAPVGYDDLIHLHCRSDGGIAAIETDLFACNAVCSALLHAISESTGALSDNDILIPAGNLSGIAFLSGKGPECHIRLLIAQGIRAHLETSFTEIGINQTQHTLRIVAETDVTFLIPGHYRTETLRADFPIAETVLLGDVPEAYTRIHRLTDDITETEIDDIYDFGATPTEK